MNELLQKHGCANVFSVPEGLRELMSDISREVLREQPTNIFEFIANYLSVLLITREHGVLALRILDELCDCKPSVSEHLMHLGMERGQAETLAQIIKEEIENFEPAEGREKIKEMYIMKKILARSVLDEEMSAKVCQVARNAYRDYWYRKKLLEQSLKVQPDEPWEMAAQHTLELYKMTKPSFSELTRATQKIQAAYRGYHVRKNLLNHLRPKRKKQGPKVDLLGPPADIASSREIDLGPMINIKIQEDNVNVMFNELAGEKIGLHYDPMKTITHVEYDDDLADAPSHTRSASLSTKSPQEVQSTKSMTVGPTTVQSMHSKKSTTGGPTTSQSVQLAKAAKSDVMSTKSLPAVDTKSRLSREEDVVLDGPRQSRLPSQIGPGARQSRINSQLMAEQYQSLHKISFAERPPEVIPDLEDSELQDFQEVQEEYGIVPAEAVEGEPGQEIIEDIPDNRSDGDGESAPTVSVPSSVPVSGDNTDVDDAGGNTTGED